VIGNDVEAAALGETYFGSGKDSNNFICIFVGTGIGGAIVYNGQLMHGASGSAGEIGHMVLYPYGRICGCGALGCLEAYASRTAITREIFARLKRGHDSVIRDQIKPEDTVIRSSVLADAVRLKDELAISVINQAAEFMGLGLASIMNFYNPERIILGGGVVEALDLYTNKAVQQAKLSSLKGPSKKTEFIRAALGDYAGVIGAATMVVNGRN
jgi:glucokinase